MAIIAAPVGQRGANLPADVRTIQLLLNKVPAKVGGPTVALKPDGVAGPKTIGAIVAFQRAQFGPASADGRVDPGRQTLVRLSTFDVAASVPPPPAGPVPVPFPSTTDVPEPVLSRQFIMVPVKPGDRFGFHQDDFFFKLIQVPLQASAVYWLGNGQPPRPTPTQFDGKIALLRTREALPIDGLEGIAALSSQGLKNGARTTITMVLPSGSAVIEMGTHLAEPGNPISVGGFAAPFKLVRVLSR